jgi:dissimilatory sulfite reductase (desulfoviridin) alpha/beta subunit
MKKNTIKKLEESAKPPPEIIKAVKLIENWAKKQTDRDDWAIGEIACRKGFERLLKDIKNVR